jgi:Protein of unknown function (DUF3631)
MTSAKTTAGSTLSDLEKHFKKYAALGEGISFVLALWSLATYSFDDFDAFPYLAITSPTKRCGKTRVAELLELASANPLRTVGISPAALFRTIESKKPTLLLDEAEALSARDERANALREILNAGYRKGQKVIRCEGAGKTYKTREFETFCPKVLVLIGNLPDTLADRCIPIPMKRRTNEQLERFRYSQVKAESTPLRTRAEELSKNSRLAIRGWYDTNDIGCLTDRDAELWLPLFAVCAVLAPERVSELERVAARLSGTKSAGELADFGVKLLGDVQEIFSTTGLGRLSTNNLLKELNDIQESPWAGWSMVSGLNARSLSTLLGPFGIGPRNLRLGDAQKVVKGYYRADFDDAWARYLGRGAATRISGQQDSATLESATVDVCSGSQNEEIANIDAVCSDVADGNQSRDTAEFDLSQFADSVSEESTA